jgi:glycosyltransferase involved in cell wall biosynthesis
MKQLPTVSVCMISYNHENFIEEAINSVLMQECDFEVELIIANDNSPDATNEVIEKIIKNNENDSWIKYFKNEKNIGMMPNFLYALQKCKGKYIAICEGDDYWTDPLKLKKQVDAMEADSDIGLVYTNYKITREEENRTSLIAYDKLMPEGYCLDKIIKGKFPWTVTTMLRKSLIENDIEKILKPHYLMGDFPLWLHLAANSKLKYLPDITSVYRRNLNSVSASSISLLKKVTFNLSWVEILKDFIDKNNISDIKLLRKTEPLIQLSLLNAFSMSLQANDTQLAKSIWKDLKLNKTPIPFKHQLLHKSISLGALGKWLINYYYKK